MTSAAWVALLLGCGGLAALLYFLIKSSGVQPDSEPSGWTGSDAAQRWDEKAKTAREDFGLQGVRDTAKTWGASIAGLLGILSTVAFVAGPNALVDDVGGTEADIAAWLILIAASTAAVAVTLAILAEQGSPQWSDDLTGWVYRSLTRKRAAQAARQLRTSRYLVLAALVLIILATGIAWMTPLTGKGKPPATNAIVVTSSGAKCGPLSSDSGALSMEVGGQKQPIADGGQITLVDSCP